MKINPAAAYQAYNRISDHTHSPRRTGQYPEGGALKAGNTDQIQISHEGTRKMEAEQLSRSIMAEIREPASPERIEAVRAELLVSDVRRLAAALRQTGVSREEAQALLGRLWDEDEKKEADCP